jgi:hypothetical protein
MMKDSDIKVFWPWMRHSFVERDIDLDGGFDPVSIVLLVNPAGPIIWTLAAISTQLRINTSPIIACNVFQVKGRVSNYLKETLEALL